MPLLEKGEAAVSHSTRKWHRAKSGDTHANVLHEVCGYIQARLRAVWAPLLFFRRRSPFLGTDGLSGNQATTHARYSPKAEANKREKSMERMKRMSLRRSLSLKVGGAGKKHSTSDIEYTTRTGTGASSSNTGRRPPRKRQAEGGKPVKKVGITIDGAAGSESR